MINAEQITAINRIGVGKFRIQTSAVTTPKTILDRWYFTVENGN